MRKYAITKQSLKPTSLILCLTLALTGCAAPGPYRIRSGDELRVVIWNEMDEKAVVRPDHRISLPLVGEVSCKGKTPETLSRELSDKFETRTTVMVTKPHSGKDTFKDFVGIARDIAILYFLAERFQK
jgi:protein involved in polysaccharide export with SLBB domain